MTADSAPFDSPTSLASASSYRGRFAPSPTGRLHLGSLLSGYGALWRARSQNGTFVIRLEDLDGTRCTQLNLLNMYQDLALFGLTSDEEIMVQSAHTAAYKQCLNQLLEQNHAYYCTCTRAQLQKRPCPCAQTDNQERIRAQLAHAALNHAASAPTEGAPTLDAASAAAGSSVSANTNAHDAAPVPASACAVRLELTKLLDQESLQQFADNHLGLIRQPRIDGTQPNESYTTLPNPLTLKRSDQFYAYNFAVVIDDHRQGISEVVRGADLLDSTFLQLALYQLLGYSAPQFCHLPLLTDNLGRKFSKQNHAVAAVGDYTPYRATYNCWKYLQQTITKTDNSVITRLDSDQSLNHLHTEFRHTEKELHSCVWSFSNDYDNIKKDYLNKYLADWSPEARNKYCHKDEIFPYDTTYLINAILYCHLANPQTDPALHLAWQRAASARQQALATASPECQALINVTSLDNIGTWQLEHVLSDEQVAKMSVTAKLYYELLQELHRQFVACFDLQTMPKKAIVL